MYLSILLKLLEPNFKTSRRKFAEKIKKASRKTYGQGS